MNKEVCIHGTPIGIYCEECTIEVAAHKQDLIEVYKNVDGEVTALITLIKQEPEWAINVIKAARVNHVTFDKQRERVERMEEALKYIEKYCEGACFGSVMEHLGEKAQEALKNE